MLPQNGAPSVMRVFPKGAREPLICPFHRSRLDSWKGAMSLFIKNGEIVTADARYTADIYCEGETITRIDRDIVPPEGAEVIDAAEKFVFPGFIDPHVHIYLPFMGTYAKDNYETGSRGALVGGTTTL